MIEFGTKLRIFIISLACLFLIGWIDPATDKNEEGRKRYNEGEYGEAISRFTDAQLHLPESGSLNFNIANTHYKVGKLPEAEKSYKGILDSKDVTLKTKANYNMGNTMYKQGKLNEALDFYKKAIKLTDKESGVNDEIKRVREDAKYNYEFVQKKMEEMKKEQQEREEKEEQEKQEKQEKQEQEKQDDQKQGEGQDEKPKEENPDQQEQQQQEKEQEEQDKNNEGRQENEPPPENEKSPSQPYEKKEMTKEEAERILDALRQSERSARDMQEKEDKPAGFMIEKNW